MLPPPHPAEAAAAVHKHPQYDPAGRHQKPEARFAVTQSVYVYGFGAQLWSPRHRAKPPHVSSTNNKTNKSLMPIAQDPSSLLFVAEPRMQ